MFRRHAFVFSRKAIAKAAVLRREYLEAMLGSTAQVLFEEIQGGCFVGHTPNYTKVYVSGENLHNEIRSVRLEKLYEDGIFGTILP